MKKLFLTKKEWIALIFIYIILFYNLVILHDSVIAIISAFCGITYTILAGKGNPICYLIGITGSVFYTYLSYTNHFWGNALLYALYFIPMQIIGFFKWNQNLKKDKYEIIKNKLPRKELYISLFITIMLSAIIVLVLYIYNDSNPLIDGITTSFSILGMYYTVRRAIEQWFIWGSVNLLSLIMWIIIALSGAKVYSTIIMWLIYSILAIYFFLAWKKELSFKD